VQTVVAKIVTSGGAARAFGGSPLSSSLCPQEPQATAFSASSDLPVAFSSDNHAAASISAARMLSRQIHIPPSDDESTTDDDNPGKLPKKDVNHGMVFTTLVENCKVVLSPTTDGSTSSIQVSLVRNSEIMISIRLGFDGRSGFNFSFWDENCTEPTIKNQDRVVFIGLLRRYVYFVAEQRGLRDSTATFDSAQAHFFYADLSAIDHKSPSILQKLLNEQKCATRISVTQLDSVCCGKIQVLLPTVASEHNHSDWLLKAIALRELVRRLL